MDIKINFHKKNIWFRN